MQLDIASFLIRKLFRLALLLIAVAVFSFVLISLSPIDPIDAYVGADMLQISPEQREIIAARWGLDQPMLTRFGLWLRQLASGNLGISMIFNQKSAYFFVQKIKIFTRTCILPGFGRNALPQNLDALALNKCTS